MRRMIIEKLYLFSLKEKKAKMISFASGINIITSSKVDGTKRGKSVILKSIYYTLGAECFFEDKWNINDKISIVEFSIEGVFYYICRHQRLFKIYLKDDFREVFRTIHWDELAEYLGSVFQFSVKLPNQTTGKMELAPPVYNYLLTYTDQDKMDGSKFASFKNLGQYSDFKEKVLYYHFNIYNEEYYDIIQKIEKLSEEKAELEKQLVENQGILVRINKSINNNDYSKNLDILRVEIEQMKTEYISIMNKLSQVKKKLIKFRNEKEDLIDQISALELFEKDTEKDIKKIVKHQCPLCNSYITDLVEVRTEKYNTVEDILFLKMQLESSVLEVDRKIELEEERYSKSLTILNSYENKIKINSQEIDDVLKYRGYIEIRDSIVKELGEGTSDINEKITNLEELNSKKRKYDIKKSKVNKKYCSLMVNDKNRFSLQEISDDKLTDIGKNFSAGGSNKPIASVIWYMNLLKLKKEFNSQALIFPLIMDSPNNAETDDEKKIELLRYIFETVDEGTQLILSTLGFDKEEFPDMKFDFVLELNNDKYQLLTDREYENNKSFLQRFMEE